MKPALFNGPWHLSVEERSEGWFMSLCGHLVKRYELGQPPPAGVWFHEATCTACLGKL